MTESRSLSGSYWAATWETANQMNSRLFLPPSLLTETCVRVTGGDRATGWELISQGVFDRQGTRAEGNPKTEAAKGRGGDVDRTRGGRHRHGCRKTRGRRRGSGRARGGGIDRGSRGGRETVAASSLRRLSSST